MVEELEEDVEEVVEDVEAVIEEVEEVDKEEYFLLATAAIIDSQSGTR